MESIIENPILIWTGLLLVVPFVIIKHLTRRRTEPSIDPESSPKSDDRNAFQVVTNLFISDVSFLLAFLFFGLTTALVFRAGTATYSIADSWPFKPKFGPLMFAYKAFLPVALALIIVFQSEIGLFAYGLLTLTVLCWLGSRKAHEKATKEEGGGRLESLKVISVLAIGYFGLVAASASLWLIGGLDVWIWFYIFSRLIAAIVLVACVQFLRRFFNILGRAIHDTTRPLG